MFIYAVSRCHCDQRAITLKSHAGCQLLYSRCINRSGFFSANFLFNDRDVHAASFKKIRCLGFNRKRNVDIL